jgi:hypothetical protein
MVFDGFNPRQSDGRSIYGKKGKSIPFPGVKILIKMLNQAAVQIKKGFVFQFDPGFGQGRFCDNPFGHIQIEYGFEKMIEFILI